MISNPSLVRDCSTLANFKNWAKAISDFFATIGWTKTADTGQVNWATIGAVPSPGALVYEIWQPGDALTPFYLKIYYGVSTNYSNCPRIVIQIGTGTSGAGALTGYITSSFDNNNFVITVTSTTTGWDCRFSGDASRINIMLYRDETQTYQQMFFGVERSIDASGNYTSDYVTLLGCTGSTNANSHYVFQQSLVFGLGVGYAITPGTYPWIGLRNQSTSSGNFIGNIPIGPVFPDVGYFGNPMTIVACGSPSDFTEAATYTIAAANMPYGVAHTYIATKRGILQWCFPMPWNQGTGGIYPAFLMRYD